MAEALAEIGENGLELIECNSQRFCNQLRNASSLKDNIIDVLEGAYQVVKGRLRVRDLPEGWLGALEIVNSLLGDIDLFLVYYDLRRRGRRVKRGVRPRTLHVHYSDSKVFEILVLSEGKSTSIRRIAEWSRAAVRDDYEPVIAIVDDYGIVTYYEARASSTLS